MRTKLKNYIQYKNNLYHKDYYASEPQTNT